MPNLRDETVEAHEVDFFADFYDGHRYSLVGWKLRLQRELGTLRRMAGHDRLGRVLSIGCGDGQFELMLARHADSVTGLDLSPEAISLARANQAKAGASNLVFHCQSFSELEWADQYDAIVCLSFLHHVPSDAIPDLLKNIYDHLSPGGCFYSIDPNIHGVARKLGRLILGPRYDRFHSPDERELDPSEVTSALRSAGFGTIRIAHNDLALIPALFLFPRSPDWIMRFFAAFDQLWCRTPLARWSSAFSAFARKQ